MKQVLICVKCKSKLSEAVQIFKEGEPNYPAPNWIDGAPISAKGIALMSKQPMVTAIRGPKPYLEFAPQYWMRLDDILPIVGNIDDGYLWQGCCGPSGECGPNRQCTCGEPVGSERNDCWTPKVFVPDPKATRWQNEK